MLDYKIIPINEKYIEKFCSAVTSVARERKYLASLEGPTLEMAQKFVQENIAGKWPHYIAINNDDDVIGWCDITSLHRDIYAHIGVLGIGVVEKYRSKGVGKALIKKALGEAKIVGLTRIQLTVRESNDSAIKLYEDVGFKREGIHVKAIRVDGRYENSISMALLFE